MDGTALQLPSLPQTFSRRFQTTKLETHVHPINSKAACSRDPSTWSPLPDIHLKSCGMRGIKIIPNLLHTPRNPLTTSKQTQCCLHPQNFKLTTNNIFIFLTKVSTILGRSVGSFQSARGSPHGTVRNNANQIYLFQYPNIHVVPL